MRIRAVVAVLALAGGLLAPSQAAGQDDAALLRDGVFARDRNISVTERPKPEYAPLPVRLSAFLISPQVTSSLSYDDNILASDYGTRSDAIVAIRPSLSLRSDWSRSQISAFVRAAQSLYLDHSDQDTTDDAAGFGWRLDVRHDLGVAGGVGIEHDTEPRTSEASPAEAARPVQYDLASAWAESSGTLNRLRLTVKGSVEDYAYGNVGAAGGAEIYQRDQDRTESGAAGSAEYVYSPELSLRANLTVNRRQYRDAAPGEASRTSSGYETTVGANFDLTSLVRGDIRIGYLNQAYQSPTFRRASGLALNGRVEYFPTGLTTITASAGRSVQDSGIPGVAGFIANYGGGEVDHELLRNLVLNGRLDYAENDYLNYGRRDQIQTARAGASYLMNRLVSLSLNFTHLVQRSRGADAGPQYAINRVATAITCQF
jgi:hypothetical protein